MIQKILNGENKEKTALITDRNEKISYMMLDGLVDTLAESLKGGSLALLVMNNDIGPVIFYLTCLKVHIIPIILDKTASKTQIHQYIQKYEPEYIFMLSCDGYEVSSVEGYDVIKRVYRHILLENRGKRKKIYSDLAILLPTSGTTSVSKLVRISKTNLYDNTENICHTLQIEKTDVAVTSLPLAYCYGLSILNTHLFAHATILLTDKSILQKRFWEFTERYGATSFAGVPYTYELLKKNRHLERENSIKVYTQAGGKLSVEVQCSFFDYCIKENKKFFVMYGQTEATARISILQMEEAKNKMGSVGKPIRGGNVQIEKNVNTGKSGEIIYSGKNVMLGYCSCPEDLALGDINGGILYTGDIGYLDEDGYLYVTGRKCDFVKLYGRRICLKDITRMIDELYGLETLVVYENNKIVILYEKKSEKKMLDVSRNLFLFLHISQTDIVYRVVNRFSRTYNGKICIRGEENGRDI